MQGTSYLFITDPLRELNPKKDTTILWKQEIFRMGGQGFQGEMKDLIYVGLPLTLIFWYVAVSLIPIYWPQIPA